MDQIQTSSSSGGQMDERISPSLRFCPFLNIPDSSKRKNLECFYTRTIKAVYSIISYSKNLWIPTKAPITYLTLSLESPKVSLRLLRLG